MNHEYISEERKLLLKKLEEVVRGSGDNYLSITPFFERIVRALTVGGCSVSTVSEIYALPYSFVFDVQSYIDNSFIFGAQ